MTDPERIKNLGYRLPPRIGVDLAMKHARGGKRGPNDHRNFKLEARPTNPVAGRQKEGTSPLVEEGQVQVYHYPPATRFG